MLTRPIIVPARGALPGPSGSTAHVVLGTLICALVCSAPAWGQSPAATSQPTSEPIERGDIAADLPATLDPLATRMIAFTGDPMQAERIAFTFTAAFDTLRVFERSYVWRPREGRLTVLQAQRYIEFEGIDRVDPSSAVRHPRRNADVWRSVAPDARPRHAARAWRSFINDRWWLMAPAFVVAPGSEVTVVGDTVGVYFASGGVTPGDTFHLTVDPATGAVTSWTFDLHGGMHGDYAWSEYETFGGLRLALLRVASSGLATIRFESVEVR